MKKHAPELVFVATALSYLTAFLQSSSSLRLVYPAPGTVFLVLGIANARRRSNR